MRALPFPTSRRVNSFQIKVYSHFKKHRRDFPWRHTKNPYHILVSEVMLQQTQVARVIEKYKEFLKAFPTIQSLARAPLRRVLKVWQGLGYNRRAIYLKKTAEPLCQKFGGKVPQSTEELEKLPGIGKITAGAIAAFAFNKPVVFIETNIRTVFIHHFFPKKRGVRDAEILPLIEQTLDRKNPRAWYAALMDYGSMLKKKHKNPSRRSKHYGKQTRFHGSGRQIRGAIIRALVRKGRYSFAELQCVFAYVESVRLRNIVQALEREKMIKKVNNAYAIA